MFFDGIVSSVCYFALVFSECVGEFVCVGVMVCECDVFIAVSYTHLDVYKRQTRCPFCRIEGPTPAGAMLRPDPVSYTHLDVYKRQG